MTTTHQLDHPGDQAKDVGGALTRALLTCGVVYSLAYVIANDVVAASLYAGYSRADQAISELSATSAPTAPFLRAMLPVFTGLLLGFGAGVWRAAHGSLALRLTGGLIGFSAVVGISWLWFPMTSREDIVSGPFAANDVGHFVLSGLTVVLILAQMGFGAAALGKGFRVFSVACAVTLLGFGAVMGTSVPGVAAGEATRWMGLFERLMLAGWLVWMAGFAVALLRRGQGRLATSA